MCARELRLVAVLVSLFSAAAHGAASPPDISGIWVGAGDSGEEQTKQTPQFTPEYQAKHEANQALYASAETGAAAKAPDSILVRRMGGGCLPYGMPRLMNTQDSVDIAQMKDRILILGENGEDRRIWLDRQQVPLDEVAVLGFFGRSVGKWEGDVLVVNTIGVKKELEGEDNMPHSEQMVITERIYLKGGLLIDDVTITDPLALKKPWTFTYKRQRAPKDYEPLEWVCDVPHYRFDENGKLIVE